jgi:hypothetical protein
MSTPNALERATRVFAMVPSRRYTGYAVLDASGVSSRGFGSWSLRRRKTEAQQAASIKDRITETILCCAPTVIVVGVPIRNGTEAASLRDAAECMAKARGIPVVRRQVANAEELLLDGCGDGAEDGLAKLLIGAFFPELAGWLIERAGTRRYRHNAFSALALALHELAIRSPLAAAVISKDEAFEIGAWKALLAEQAQRLYQQEKL